MGPLGRAKEAPPLLEQGGSNRQLTYSFADTSGLRLFDFVFLKKPLGQYFILPLITISNLFGRCGFSALVAFQDALH